MRQLSGQLLLRVWTGTELLLYGYVYSAETETKTFTAAYNPATNTWRKPPSCPYPVLNIEGGYRVMWTGTEMRPGSAHR